MSKKDFAVAIYLFSNKFIVRKHNWDTSVAIIISTQGANFKLKMKNEGVLHIKFFIPNSPSDQKKRR